MRILQPVNKELFLLVSFFGNWSIVIGIINIIMTLIFKFSDNFTRLHNIGSMC